MTNNQLTRERIELIANFHRAMTLPPSHDEIEELARMALAAMDREPDCNEQKLFCSTDTARMRKVISASDGTEATPLYRHAQQAPVVVPEGLNPETTDLVLRFASALADKLYKAEQKYGRSTDWMKDDWYDDCLQSLWEHIEKGDPRDVAAYCAFMWYHGWVTTDYDRNVQNACRAAMLQAVPLTNEGDIALHNYRTAMEGIGHIRRTLEETFGGLHGTHVEPDVLIECKTICDAIYAAYSGSSPVIQDGKSVTASTGIPVIPDGYVMVPKEPTEEMNKAGWAAMNEHDSINPTYRAMLSAAPQLPGSEHATVPGSWIPVSERMPENDGAYLCWDKRYVTTYAFIFGAWQANQFIAKNITHWMPLPAAPQEEKP